MIAKQLDGVLPEPGDFSDNDKAILAQADGMIAIAREAMTTQQIHQALNAVWAVVAEANRYFAGEAPWALAKTDPARQGTVLYVTAEVVRQIAILAQPAMPAASAKLLDILGIPDGEARISRRSAAVAHRAGHDAAGAGRRIPALCRTARRPERLTPCWSTAIAISTSPISPTISTASSRAHEAAGIGRMVTISTRVKRLAGLLEIAERFPNVYCSVGTHPHHADEEDGISADELIALTRHPKVVALGEAGLDYFYDNGSPRGAGARLPRPYRRRPRHRPAAGDPYPRCRRGLRAHPGRGDGEGTVSRGAALLHRRAGACDEGDRAWVYRFRSRAS